MHSSDLLTLIVQIILILALSRIVGMLFARIHQPQVIGEMVAGIMLGPSLLGLLAPVVYQTLFPRDSIEYLRLFSQFGVIFFLFLIGLEFDPNLVRRRGRSALFISAASIILPFIIGVLLTFWLYPRLFTDASRESFLPTALFMGAAISVTAFPVLARILSERNLHKTEIGAICITGAAVNDVIAWCMLAFVVAVSQYDPNKGPSFAAMTALMAGGYVAFMLLAVKPFLRRLQAMYDRRGGLSQNVMATVFLLILASAYTTEKIGIHALFGAFLMGCVMPKGSRFVRDLSEKLEDYTVVFLLPIFFAYAGLSTDLGLIFHQQQWGYAAIIIVAACVGKIGGASLASRLSRQPWRESLAIGILMNTRGLMELIILGVGLSLGVINQNVYAMMVIMTLVTTAMTTPLLAIVYPEEKLRGKPAQPPAGRKLFTVLVPISDPTSGAPLVAMAAVLAGDADQRRLLALHLRRPEERDAYRAGLEDAPPVDPILEPLMALAKTKKIDVEPVSFVTRDVPDDIASVARSRQVDLVLMGFHRPVFGKAILGGTVHRVLRDVPADVGIFVNRGGDEMKKILVPYLGSTHDRLALELALRLSKSSPAAAITVLHVVPPKRGDGQDVLGAKAAVDRVFSEPGQASPLHFKVLEHPSPVDAVLAEAEANDLVIIGVAEQWDLESHLFGFRSQRIALECERSLLIVRKFARGVAASAATR